MFFILVKKSSETKYRGSLIEPSKLVIDNRNRHEEIGYKSYEWHVLGEMADSSQQAIFSFGMTPI